MTRLSFLGGLFLLVFAFSAQAAVRVEVVGLGSDEKTNVEARLAIHQQADRKDLTQEMVEHLNDQAPADIRQALQPFGWYSPTIKTKLRGSAPNWVVHYYIEAGPRTNIAKVDVQVLGEGAEFDAFKPVLRRIARRLVVGDRLKHADYELSKKQIADAAYEGGFLDAYWAVSELRVSPDTQQAEIFLHLETGPRYFFGEVTLQQQGEQPLNVGFINRYISLQAGEPFDPAKLLKQQFALSDLGYFDSVQITPERTLADEQHRVPLTILTTPRKKHRYQGGVGYGTDTGARVSAGTQWRQINQYGHNLDVETQVSQIKDQAVANYRIPLGNKPTENLTFSALEDNEDIIEGHTDKYIIGASINRHPGDWQRRVYLEFSHENSTFGDQFTRANLLTPGVAFTRTDSDDPIFAHRGWFLSTDVHGGQHELASSVSFVRTDVLTRGVYSLDHKTRLLGRIEIGADFTGHFLDLPATQRFFAGGDESVRGYDYQSIGKRDAGGYVIGGKYLTTFSTEIERQIKGNWGAAVFVDGGGADSVFPPRLYFGVGAGVRYRAPVGDFQVDLAHPLNDPAQEQFLSLRLHVGVRIGL